MNLSSHLKNLWLAVAVLGLALTLTVWFGYDSVQLRYLILGLNALMFLLALPCALAAVPVAVSANYFLELNALSPDGIYLNTFCLLFIGAVQWFLVAPFWTSFETQMQRLDLHS